MNSLTNEIRKVFARFLAVLLEIVGPLTSRSPFLNLGQPYSWTQICHTIVGLQLGASEGQPHICPSSGEVGQFGLHGLKLPIKCKVGAVRLRLARHASISDISKRC